MSASRYKKKNLHEHILTRPETYIGGVKKINEQIYILDENKIIKKNVSYCPGFVKIFDEILVNAIDQSVRNNGTTYIKVSINKDLGVISIENDGVDIPIEIHPEYKVYVPELIFGNLLTSSNYDDSEERIVGGVNGIGSKATCVFSQNFKVEVSDGKQLYTQVFKRNMYDKTQPKIKPHTKKPFIRITFLPDYGKLDMEGMDSSSYALLCKRVYDTAWTSKVAVHLNGKKLPVKSIKDYAKYYTDFPVEVFEVKMKDRIWEIGVAYSADGYKHVSFVNGISTYSGGKHVDYLVDTIVKNLSDLLQSKKKITNIKNQYIKDHIQIFLRATIVNPKFSSQSKDKLTTPVKDFGINVKVPDSFINKLYKTQIIEEAIALTNFKNRKELDKNVSKKNKIKIPKLDDAHNAGTSKSRQCSLILTEGDSAKTFAISGLSVIGRENYGVFALRGKALNVREATQQQLMKNEEILNIKKIMNLQTTKKYKTEEDLKTLRYGSIIILTDSDADGTHIASLLINFIHYWWPELLEVDNFIKTIKTPILKVFKGKETKVFYNKKEYESFLENSSGNWRTKYYKGLGTSTASEAKDIFKQIKTHQYSFKSDEHTDKKIVLAFDKKRAEDRKTWLEHVPDKHAEADANNKIKISDYIDYELIHFSNYDNIRSIPSVIDGLKPSQRKVLFAAFKRDLQKEIKVAQFGAAVAEITAYHHGEASLYSTIISMAQNYTGSNNINLLEPCGQFGTRSMLGKDSASPRYIFTKLTKQVYDIFNKEDFNVLEYLQDDGEDIEPKFYVPNLPMLLVNGSIGIGTGYSTNIPSYNPEDIVENIKLIVDGQRPKELVPWYKGFTGDIKKVNETSYLCKGIIKKVDQNTFRITEIPINKSIESYKDFLENIEDFETVNLSTEENPEFLLKFRSSDDLNSFDIKKLNLTCKINISNMYAFDENNKITKFKNPNDIIRYYIKVRMNYMDKRKNYLEDKTKTELIVLKNKKRFLEDIIKENIKIYRKQKKEIEDILFQNKYDKVKNTYEYLTSMSISYFSKENLDKLTMEIQKRNEYLEYITKTSIKKMYIEELNNLKK